MARNLVETLMGAVVVVVAILFVGFTYSTAGLGTVEGYKLVAKFDRVDGLLGDKYLSLTAGAEDAMIKPGGTIEHTQGSVDIVSLVGRVIFSQTGKEKKEGAAREGVK